MPEHGEGNLSALTSSSHQHRTRRQACDPQTCLLRSSSPPEHSDFVTFSFPLFPSYKKNVIMNSVTVCPTLSCVAAGEGSGLCPSDCQVQHTS